VVTDFLRFHKPFTSLLGLFSGYLARQVCGRPVDSGEFRVDLQHFPLPLYVRIPGLSNHCGQVDDAIRAVRGRGIRGCTPVSCVVLVEPIPVAAVKIDVPGCEIIALETLLPALPDHSEPVHAPVIDGTPNVFMKLYPGLWSQCNTTAQRAGDVLWALAAMRMEARLFHATHAATVIRPELSPLLVGDGRHLVVSLGSASGTATFLEAFTREKTACLQFWFAPHSK
jgi:hypothetical protein